MRVDLRIGTRGINTTTYMAVKQKAMCARIYLLSQDGDQGLLQEHMLGLFT